MTNQSRNVDVDLWNRISVDLMQAMIGAISNNFRQVSLTRVGQQWQIRFVLARESEEDREEIEDIGAELEALQDGPLDYETIVSISDDALDFPEFPGRVLFRRRES